MEILHRAPYWKFRMHQTPTPKPSPLKQEDMSCWNSGEMGLPGWLQSDRGSLPLGIGFFGFGVLQLVMGMGFMWCLVLKVLGCVMGLWGL